jgi:replicative superfamily II helicase
LRVEELPISDQAKRVLSENGYDTLYPPQVDAINAGVLTGKNFVLASPTASGKTLVAELAVLKKVLNGEGKALYLTPLRALASEKYEEFQKYSTLEKPDGHRVRIAITSGDYDRSDEHLGRYDIVIATNEKADSLLRHKAKWISDVVLVVSDEVHLLNEAERGPTLEVVMTRLRKLNPNIQLLALSATVRNAAEVADWIGGSAITTEWRPVPLREGVYCRNEIHFKDGSAKTIQPVTGNAIMDISLQTIREGGQALLFTETRRSAVEMGRRASAVLRRVISPREKRSCEIVARGIRTSGEKTRLSEILADQVSLGAAFHHAGLHNAHRRMVEDAFRDGKIKILAATPTLAAGVNLPARLVVITSHERYEAGYGRYPISVLEYKQFCLPHDTFVTLQDGSVATIGEIVRNRSRLKVLSLSGTHRLEGKSIRTHFEREASELVEIETNVGKRLVATPEHPVLTGKPNGASAWTPLRAIRAGDLVAYARDIPTLDRPVYWLDFLPTHTTYVMNPVSLFNRKGLPWKKKYIAQKLEAKPKTFQSYTSGRKNPPLRVLLALGNLLGLDRQRVASQIKWVKSKWGKPIRIGQLLNEDFMWLVGIVATDGHLRECSTRERGPYYHVRVFNENPRIVRKTASILRKLGLEASIYTRQTKHFVIEVGSNLLSQVISQFGIPLKNKSLQLFVPSFMLRFPRRLIAAYLAGVFDGDGSYSQVKYPRGKHTMVRAIVIATGSERFAWGIHELLLRLGIMSAVMKDTRIQHVVIGGKQRTFSNPVYRVTVRRIADIQRFRHWVKPAKMRIPMLDYSQYHHSSKYRSTETQGPTAWVKVTRVTTRKLSSPVKVYNLAVDETETYLASDFVVHNCGRAGRPKYDEYGEAVLVARTEEERDSLFENYVLAEPERLWSKLGVEKVLRPHVLSTIATGFAHTEDGLRDFFSSTFYAYQYGPRAIGSRMADILSFLAKEEMIGYDKRELVATRFGRRVSELYIDPASAVIIRDGLYRRAPELTEFSFLHLIARTPDIAPRVYPRRGEDEKLAAVASERTEQFMCEIPDELEGSFDLGYQDFLAEVKTAAVLLDWIQETPEDAILETHRVEPGDLMRLVQISDWLLYSAHELAELFGHKDLRKPFEQLRLRVEKGAKADLIPLLGLQGVGRVRARALHNAGLKTIEDIRKASPSELAEIPLIGTKLAKKIKEQAGGLIKSEEWEELRSASEETEQSLLTEYSNDDHRSD